MKKRELRIKDNYIEKEIYSFVILKEIHFEEVSYFALESEFGKKHLLPKEFYTNYELEIEKKINCYVDKINCAGEIFLEPIHQYYELNQVYSFKVLREGIKNIKGLIDYGIFFENIYNEEFFLPTSREKAKELVSKEVIELKLLRIKKGEFYTELI
jgi:hypothetical protein